ncbi:MAG TPA: hypothetical protein VG734_27465 [Lacunisphaera sp.]|nr:hypothetical protein [Lacunisphaera sp.]
MPGLARPSVLLLLAALAAVPASARLGETLGDIKKRYDSPFTTTRDTATWLFEGDNGQLAYSVTFNTKGRSIAEGFKPVKRARFPKETALEFIDGQLTAFRDSKTTRILKSGERYRFGGQDFTVAADEHVVLDEPRGFLVIWNQASNPSVMVVTPELLQRAN